MRENTLIVFHSDNSGTRDAMFVGESAVEGVMHIVDIAPTLAAPAGASPAGAKPLDGADVWPVIAEGAPGRETVVYNVEPTQAAVRAGDWKLHRLPALPRTIELFDLAAVPGETVDRSAEHSETVAALQAQAVRLAREMAPPLLFGAALGAALSAPLSRPRSGDASE